MTAPLVILIVYCLSNFILSELFGAVIFNFYGVWGRIAEQAPVTMLSTALGVTACQRGIPVKFYRTAALVNLLSEAKKAGTLGTLLKKLYKASVIILDEFGYVPYDRIGSQLLFDFLSEIHEQKSVILNTNLEFSRWVNVLYDEQMTAALVGRLMHHCHLLLFPGENNRLRESSINELYSSISTDKQ